MSFDALQPVAAGILRRQYARARATLLKKDARFQGCAAPAFRRTDRMQ